MYWTEVLGYPMPKPIGGHPALDFCDTYAGWGGPALPGGEWLADYDRLVVWTVHSGLLPVEDSQPLRTLAERRGAPAARELDAVRRLRSALYAVLLEPADTASFAIVAGEAEQAAARAELVADADGVAFWRIPSTVELDVPRLRVARAAAELLCSPERALVRACPGEECGWLFLDRRGRRRWCSMATCGNRAKVRAFEERQRRG
ncbi:ABATE domain-containing protein [Phytomonospora sp. NPDC050363]|uniref:CGNR zinc finger domain-containing protein n=1 Tax=Phytomonospora sp. NPDC050363 TaxID=3155642 RepID=UPI0033F92349